MSQPTFGNDGNNNQQPHINPNSPNQHVPAGVPQPPQQAPQSHQGQPYTDEWQGQQPQVPAMTPYGASPQPNVPIANSTRVNISEKQGVSFPAGVAVGAIILNIIVTLFVILTMFMLIGGGGAVALISLIISILVCSAISSSFIIQSPGEATVLEFFGQYMGTVRRTGFSVTLPFMKKRKVLVRTENFETPVSKVNDGDGNPINISAIVVWQLKDTAKATYAVENYQAYLQTQAEAAVRHVASEFPYDYNGVDLNRPSLLKNPDVINGKLADEVALRAEAAGIDIIEVRINNLSYSVEIAQAMLQRQQAQAVLDARGIIVAGAVGIVENAIQELSRDNDFSPEKKASLTADLLVVLVSESKVTPVLEVGKK